MFCNYRSRPLSIRSANLPIFINFYDNITQEQCPIHEDARDMARAIAKSWEGWASRRLRKKIEILFVHLKGILKLEQAPTAWKRGAVASMATPTSPAGAFRRVIMMACRLWPWCARYSAVEPIVDSQV